MKCISLSATLFQVIVFLIGKRIFALGDKGQLSRLPGYVTSTVTEYLHLLQPLLEADRFPLQRWGNKVRGRGKVIARGHPAEQKVKLEALAPDSTARSLAKQFFCDCRILSALPPVVLSN